MINGSTFLNTRVDFSARSPKTPANMVEHELDRMLQHNEMGVQRFKLETSFLPADWAQKADHNTNPRDRMKNSGAWRNEGSQTVAGFEQYLGLRTPEQGLGANAYHGLKTIPTVPVSQHQHQLVETISTAVGNGLGCGWSHAVIAFAYNQKIPAGQVTEADGQGAFFDTMFAQRYDANTSPEMQARLAKLQDPLMDELKAADPATLKQAVQADRQALHLAAEETFQYASSPGATQEGFRERLMDLFTAGYVVSAEQTALSWK